MYLYPWMLQGDRKGWTRQTNSPPPAPPHQPAVKQLRSPCLFVQKSHQPRSWRCGQKDEEIAVNLWVIENTPVSPSLPTFWIPQPLFLCGAHLLNQYTPNGTPCPSSPLSPTGLNWCKRMSANLLSGGEVTYLCSLLAVSCLPPFPSCRYWCPAIVSPSAQGVFVGKLGDPTGVWWLLLIHTRLSSL